MDIICNVPADIICAIVAAAGVNDDITVTAWKKALSFLWVCREWRIVAEPILFSMLVCGNIDYDDSRSNLGLILQRHCFDEVKQIIVCDNQDNDHYDLEANGYPENIDMMVHFGMLFVDEVGKKDMDSLDVVRRGVIFDEARLMRGADYSDDSNVDEFDSQYFFDQYGNRILYNQDELNNICSNASTNIVFKLAELCPNVTRLFFRFTCSTITNDVLANVLVNNYMKQLVKFKCNIPVADLKLKDGHHIQSLVLDDYDINSGQLLQLPPYHVKNLSLSFDGDFNWGLFKYGNLAPVSYDNLIRLELGERALSINRIERHINSNASQSAENPPLVVFPKLRILVLQNICLSYYSLKHILQFPIKVLCVEGYMQHAYQLCAHNLDKIYRLILKLRWPYITSTDAEARFIPQINKLLAKTDNISEVHVMLNFFYLDITWSSIKWFYLTHLYVLGNKGTQFVIAVIPMMSNLQLLAVECTKVYIDYVYENVAEPIIKLAPASNEPAPCNIRTVPIKWTCYSPSDTQHMDLIKKLNEDIPVIQYLAL